MSQKPKDLRDAAIWHFEQCKRELQRQGDPDTEYYVLAVNALRRSQDHTAIQNKLNEAMDVARQLVRKAALSAHDNATYLVDFTILDKARRLIPPGEDQPKRNT